MAANKDLIAMARDLAKANGFNDIGKIVDDEIQKSISNVEEMLKARQASKDKTDAYLREYLHNMPNAEMQKIPEGMRDEVISKVQEEHKKYAQAARVAASLSPSDEGYMEAVQTMNGVRQKFQALDASFNQLAQWKIQELKNAEEGAFSNGNNILDREFNAAVATDQAEFRLGDNFQIQFKRKDTKQEGLNKLYTGLGQEAINPSEQWLGLSQLPKSTMIDEDFQKDIIGLLGKYQANKIPLNEESKSIIKSQISLMLGNDRDAIVSAATDSPIDGSDTFGFDSDLVQNPNRTQELREKVIDSFAEVIFSTGGNAYDQSMQATAEAYKLRNDYTPRDIEDPPAYDYDKHLLEQSMKNGEGDGDQSPTPTVDNVLPPEVSAKIDRLLAGNDKEKAIAYIEKVINDMGLTVGDAAKVLNKDQVTKYVDIM